MTDNIVDYHEDVVMNSDIPFIIVASIMLIACTVARIGRPQLSTITVLTTSNIGKPRIKCFAIFFCGGDRKKRLVVQPRTFLMIL